MGLIFRHRDFGISKPVSKGVKQRCILAPLVFHIYINDIVLKFAGGPEFVVPTLGHKNAIVFYWIQMIIVLISLTRMELKRLLYSE